MSTPKAPVTPAVLVWAREIAGLTTTEASKAIGVKAERLEQWEQGESEPTVGQLRKLARLYRRTPALFFIPAPPASDLPAPPDFRGIEHAGEMSPALRRELRRAVDRRKTFTTLDRPPRNKLQEMALEIDDPVQAAAPVREHFGVTINDQFSARDPAAALALWMNAVEDAGVLVFQMSRIDPSEVRGFSIYESDVPVVVLNGGDPPQARSFTLLHEIFHLLHKSGGVCDLWSNKAMERRCNQFAANVLMPKEAFLEELGGENPLDALPRLATTFRVSRDAAAIRLRTLARITGDEVHQVRSETDRRVAEKKAKDRENEGGPPHHRTHLRNLGPRYVSRVLEALDSEAITLVDAAYLLDAKVSTIDRMSAELERRAVISE